MTNDELKARIELAKQQIQEVTLSFKKDTGFTISKITPSVIDASSYCGQEWLPGLVTLEISA